MKSQRSRRLWNPKEQGSYGIPKVKGYDNCVTPRVKTAQNGRIPRDKTACIPETAEPIQAIKTTL
ncbi:hypothetical protein AXF42_Ash016639 [Apostasia shenzhenica]|uniref:Uncharacterized protein n=1 Tax=Apostasia shenzhenica TaxID=1088818 RepID=A0A2I0A1N0_9ASPA|nr:hypothetical protein AXF42_Ash016639 [Apostasia shenzhenica]